MPKKPVNTELAPTTSPSELQSVQPSQEDTVLLALMRSIESGQLTPESLSQVLDAQERILDRQAKQEFAIAMSNCQAEMPVITKTEYNKQTKSAYEGLDGLNRLISPIYTKHGFAVSFGTDDCPIETFMRITAELSHRGGWTKSYHYDLPFDSAGIQGAVNKTQVHASGSTMSYGRRYLLKMIFNLTTSEDFDDDGNSERLPEKISVDQVNTIHAKVTENGLNMDLFLGWLQKKFAPAGVREIEDLPQEGFNVVINKLDQTIQQKIQAEKEIQL